MWDFHYCSTQLEYDFDVHMMCSLKGKEGVTLGRISTLTTELESCWESHRFSYSPITRLSCVAIMNHRTDHDPLMDTLNYRHVWLGGFLILLFCAQWLMESVWKDFLLSTNVLCKMKWSTWNYALIEDLIAQRTMVMKNRCC